MIVLITHRTDFDGIASGALIARYHLLYEPAQVLAFLKDYGDEADIVEETLFGLSPRRMYIADISTSFRHLDEVLERIKRVGPKEALWFDHHPTDTLDRVEGAGIKCDVRAGMPSTASIILERLYGEVEDEIASAIAKLAVEADTWRFESPETKDIIDLVAYYNYIDRGNPLTPHLKSYMFYLASLEQPRFLGDWHIAHVEIYRRKVAEQKELLERTAKTFDLSGLKAAIAFAPSLFSSSQAADMVFDLTGAQIAIIVKEEGTGSVRRRGTDVDISKIAKVFGGGGHPYAAGMKLRDEEITPEEFPEVAEWIVKKLSGLNLKE